MRKILRGGDLEPDLRPGHRPAPQLSRRSYHSRAGIHAHRPVERGSHIAGRVPRPTPDVEEQVELAPGGGMVAENRIIESVRVRQATGGIGLCFLRRVRPEGGVGDFGGSCGHGFP